jgi:hypothetical protein
MDHTDAAEGLSHARALHVSCKRIIVQFDSERTLVHHEQPTSVIVLHEEAPLTQNTQLLLLTRLEPSHWNPLDCCVLDVKTDDVSECVLAEWETESGTALSIRRSNSEDT